MVKYKCTFCQEVQMNTRNDSSRIIIEIPKEQHRRLKTSYAWKNYETNRIRSAKAE